MAREKAFFGWRYRTFGRLFGELPLPVRVRLLYLIKCRALPILKEPKSFNAKVQWRKLYDRNALFSTAADKIASKHFVKSLCPEVITPRILWTGRRAEEIDFASLPEAYVVKANHGSRMNLFVKDGRHPRAEELQRCFDVWGRHDQAAVLGEVAYGDVVPTFFIEEYLDFGDHPVPADYKFFVYGGRARFIQVDVDRFGSHRRNILDREWRDTGIEYTYPRQESLPDPPSNSAVMLEIAEKLGQPFDFMRVDLYSDGRFVYFGELTVYPGAGYERFSSKEVDRLFGESWELAVGA